MFYEITKKAIKLRFKYDEELVRRVKVGFKGASWNGQNKVWSIPRSLFNEARLENLFLDYSFTDQATEEDLGDLSMVGIPTSGETSVVEEYIKMDLDLLLTPRPYQYTGVTYMLKHKTCINADDMGLGKTGQSVIAAELGDLFPCLVIAPSGVKFNWEKEWKKWVQNRGISVIDGKQKNFNADVVSISYGLLRNNMKALSKIKWKSVIVDESHNCKNGKAQRTKAVTTLAKGVEYIFLLSGTAILNKPSDIISQINILGRFDDLFGNWKKFVYKFCDAQNTRYGLDTSGASNSQLLNKTLREHCYIHREKSEVAKDIPAVLNQTLEIVPDNTKEFDFATADIVGYKEKYFGEEEAFKASQAEHLVMLSTLKTLSIEGKMKGIMEWVDNFLEITDEKLVVFGVNTAPLKALAERYSCPMVYGGTSAKDKLKFIENWQVSQDRIIFGNIMSMGAGVDGLQGVCSHMLVIQLPDRPADLDQAIARLHRTGQTKPVNVYKVFSTGGIDQLMWEVLLEKYEIVDAVNKGKKIQKHIGSMNDELIKRLKNAHKDD